MKPRSGIDKLFLALVAVAHAAAGLRALLLDWPAWQTWTIIALLAAAAAAAVGETLSRQVKPYFAALGVHVGCLLLCTALAEPDLALALPLLGALTVGVCFHNPWPANLAIGAACNGLLIGLAGAVSATRGAEAADTAVFLGSCAVFVVLLGLLAALVVRYRERLIDAQEENARLDRLVDRLTRANLRYQEYAKSAEATSAESERRRITRDIHDIVGYTLTNNITIMEAITDIMRINPLGVAHLVDVARQNAEEGLARAREALRRLREQDAAYPKGRDAVERLLKVFEHATGVRTEFAYSDVAWDFPEEVDSALYHIVQESLINSFRHGKASLIRVFLSRDGDRVVLRVRDNGTGASGISEGIGLSGMRERVEKLGGAVRAGNVPGGFDVEAAVPA